MGIKGADIEEKVSDDLNKKYLLICWIALIPEYRGKGNGSKLLKYAEKYLGNWKKKGIWTGCKNNKLLFYKKNGYVPRGTFQNELGDRENLMVKEK
jgi:GNAT superfamily N-acetyltransferase